MPWAWQRLTGQQVEPHGLAILMILVSWMGVVTYCGAIPLFLRSASESLPVVAGRDLAHHPTSLLLHVRDGKVQTAFAYQNTTRHYDSRRSTTTITHTCVAPVTSADWSPDQSIPIWAVCTDQRGECHRCAHWHLPDGDIIPQIGWGESTAHEAARQAAKRQNLQLGNPLRVGVWVSSARDALLSRVQFAAASIWGMFAIWAVCRMILLGWRKLLNK
jgi:hypothetical protein